MLPLSDASNSTLSGMSAAVPEGLPARGRVGPVKFDPVRALELLRQGAQATNATFRPGQLEAIEHIVVSKGRLLVVQKTGWGKSFVYLIATKLLREASFGPALLISPLLALMRNQIAAAERMGVRAETINSDNTERWREVEESINRNEVDILLISPERLANARFVNEVLAGLADRLALFVIDEAHCISDWGHDFRPHYRLIERIVRTLPSNLRLLATTATANDRVVEDLIDVIGPEVGVSRGTLARPSLALQTIRMPSQAHRLAWLAEQLPTLAGSGIIYTLTVRDAKLVAAWLKSSGLEVKAYTSQSENRDQLEQELLNNEVKALVSTSALGMGFDKPDLAFVIHYQAPGSVVHYYQQVGRAGRELDAAYGVLLSGQEDTRITDYFIGSAFPTQEEVQEVIDSLENAPAGLSTREIEANVNVRRQRIVKTLQLLSLESPAPIVQEDRKWQLTAATLSDGFWERAERLTALRRREQEQIQQYVDLEIGHMDFLIDALDGKPEEYSDPGLPQLSTATDPRLVNKAVMFLRAANFPIQPRKRWPDGTPIPPEHQAAAGSVLCKWGDAGWGRLVQRGKYHDNRFADELAKACVALVERWRPDPAPAWVTAIPSLRHPDLVPDFARGLAESLDLPFSPALSRVQDRPEQKAMENSTMQAKNVIGSLAIARENILPGPVLLIDDIVDSRWTFTVAAWELRRSGCEAVLPLALADGSTR